MIGKRFLPMATTASSNKRLYCLSNSTNYTFKDIMIINQQQQQQQQQQKNSTWYCYTTSPSITSSTLQLRNQIHQRQQHPIVFTESTYRSYHKTITTTGNSNDKSNNNGSLSVSSAEEQHKMFVDQLEEMKLERESIFGFTQEDKAAWSTAGSNHKFTSDFLQSIQNETNESNNNNTTITNVHQELDTTNSGTTTIPRAQQNNNNSIIINNTNFSHVSNDGQSIRMVDVSSKDYTIRTATAQTIILFPQEVIDAFYNSSNNTTSENELISSKGPIFATAKIAGTMSAKRTCEIIPLCHTILLDNVSIDINFSITTKTVTIHCTCTTSNSKTGVEMEALVGSTVAALTIYDMTKSVSHNIILSQTKLVNKSGGKRTV